MKVTAATIKTMETWPITQMKSHEKNQQKNHTYVDDEDDYVDEEDVNDGNESKESQPKNKERKKKGIKNFIKQ